MTTTYNRNKAHKIDSFTNTFYWFICSFFVEHLNIHEGVPKHSYFQKVNDLYTIRDEQYRHRVQSVCNEVNKALSVKERHFFKNNQGLFRTDYDPTVRNWDDTYSHKTLKDDLVALIKQAYQDCVITSQKRVSQRYHLARAYEHPSAFTEQGSDHIIPVHYQRPKTGPFGDEDFKIQHAIDMDTQQLNSREEVKQQVKQQDNKEKTELVHQMKASKPKLRQVNIISQIATHSKLLSTVSEIQQAQSSKGADQDPQKSLVAQNIRKQKQLSEVTDQDESDDLANLTAAYKRQQIDNVYEMMSDDSSDETYELTNEIQKQKKKKKRQQVTGRVDGQRRDASTDQRRDASNSSLAIEPQKVGEKQPTYTTENLKSAQNSAIQQVVKPGVAEAKTQTELDNQLQQAHDKIAQLETTLTQTNAALVGAMKDNDDLKLSLQTLQNQLEIQKQTYENRIVSIKHESSLDESAWFFVVAKIQTGLGTEEQQNQMSVIKSYHDVYLNTYIESNNFRATEAALHQAIFYSLFRAHHEAKHQVQCVMCHTLVALKKIPTGCKTINEANHHETSQNMCGKSFLNAYISRQTVFSGIRFAPVSVAYEIFRRAYNQQGKVFPIKCNRGLILSPNQRNLFLECDFSMLDDIEQTVVFNALSFEIDVSQQLQNKLNRHLIDDRGQQFQNAWSHANALIYNVLTTAARYRQQVNQHEVQNQKFKHK